MVLKNPRTCVGFFLCTPTLQIFLLPTRVVPLQQAKCYNFCYGTSCFKGLTDLTLPSGGQGVLLSSLEGIRKQPQVQEDIPQNSFQKSREDEAVQCVAPLNSSGLHQRLVSKQKGALGRPPPDRSRFSRCYSASPAPTLYKSFLHLCCECLCPGAAVRRAPRREKPVPASCSRFRSCLMWKSQWHLWENALVISYIKFPQDHRIVRVESDL